MIALLTAYFFLLAICLGIFTEAHRALHRLQEQNQTDPFDIYGED